MSAESATFCVEAATCFSSVRWLRYACTSASPKVFGFGDVEGGFFGATFKVYGFGSYAGYGKAIEFTFESTGPLIDGSAGESFTRTVALGSPDHLDINDIPVGPYIVSAPSSGRAAAARLSRWAQTSSTPPMNA